MALTHISFQLLCGIVTAIRLADMRYYDIIFMDQYMASTDKQLLGTETVRSLRSRGVKSVICTFICRRLGWERNFCLTTPKPFKLQAGYRLMISRPTLLRQALTLL
jgi:hypothetical protein